jgi:hypothetical protein
VMPVLSITRQPISVGLPYPSKRVNFFPPTLVSHFPCSFLIHPLCSHVVPGRERKKHCASVALPAHHDSTKHPVTSHTNQGHDMRSVPILPSASLSLLAELLALALRFDGGIGRRPLALREDLGVMLNSRQYVICKAQCCHTHSV